MGRRSRPRTRRFSLLEITSGLPDDSREAEEREAERRLRELRGRVRATRAVIAGSPGLSERLAGDWRMAARFYARFGVTEGQVQHATLAAEEEGEALAGCTPSSVDRISGDARAGRGSASRGTVDVPPGRGWGRARSPSRHEHQGGYHDRDDDPSDPSPDDLS